MVLFIDPLPKISFHHLQSLNWNPYNSWRNGKFYSSVEKIECSDRVQRLSIGSIVWSSAWSVHKLVSQRKALEPNNFDHNLDWMCWTWAGSIFSIRRLCAYVFSAIFEMIKIWKFILRARWDDNAPNKDIPFNVCSFVYPERLCCRRALMHAGAKCVCCQSHTSIVHSGTTKSIDDICVWLCTAVVVRMEA